MACTAGGHEGTPTSPRFLEMTWSSAEEFSAGVARLRTSLGFQVQEVPHRRSHVAHTGNRTCAAEVRQDLEYRRLMGYNASTLSFLVSELFPQHVDSEECTESPQELVQLTQRYATEQGMPFVAEEWVLPEVPERRDGSKAGKGSKMSKRNRRRQNKA